MSTSSQMATLQSHRNRLLFSKDSSALLHDPAFAFDLSMALQHASTSSTQNLESDANDINNDHPPVLYIANMIAAQLLKHGHDMYGRRSDADCILNVGEQRFYVHVQMLAARSPTFRCIFDDMIAHNAWQAASPTAPHSRGSEAGANGLNSVRPQSAQFLPCDEGQAGQCSPHGEGMQEGLLHSTNHPERLDPLVKSALTPDMIFAIQQVQTSAPHSMPPTQRNNLGNQGEHNGVHDHGWLCASDGRGLDDNQSSSCNDTSSVVHQLQLQYAAMSLGTSNNTPHRSLPRSNAIESLHQYNSTAKRPKDGCEGHMVSESDDEGMGSDHSDEDSIESGNSDGEDGDEEMNDDGLPELRLDLADPEGSRFEELLYWLYTDDHERWLAAFTPSNYRSILANILTLNIANSDVLELCRRFEQQHPAESGIHGLADSQLRPFPPS